MQLVWLIVLLAVMWWHLKRRGGGEGSMNVVSPCREGFLLVVLCVYLGCVWWDVCVCVCVCVYVCGRGLDTLPGPDSFHVHLFVRQLLVCSTRVLVEGLATVHYPAFF